MLRWGGLNPLTLVTGQIFERHGPAESPRFRDDGRGDFPLVERIRALGLEQTERARQAGIFEDLPGPRRPTVHIPGLDGVRIRFGAAFLQRERVGYLPVMCD